MVVSGCIDHMRAMRTRIVEQGEFRGKVVYLIDQEGDDALDSSQPQVFLAEQAPNWSFGRHFHLQDEFQIVVAGDGWFGQHRVRPLLVHYAARETVYGPVVSGTDGLAYLTIRACRDRGFQLFPQEKERLTKGLRRFQTHSLPIAIHSAEAIRALASVASENLLADLPQNVACTIERMPPLFAAESRMEGDALGQFFVVLRGALCVGPALVTALGVAYASRDSLPVRLVSGDDGVEFIRVQFGA